MQSSSHLSLENRIDNELSIKRSADFARKQIYGIGVLLFGATVLTGIASALESDTLGHIAEGLTYTASLLSIANPYLFYK